MADQKAMKKRLKALMSLPENQVCSDCPERQPRWASLIVPPPGAPQGSLAMGAFCCLECSGSHRRLGVHISFVRSINLDSWKEKEVLAMENGGNARVNAVFEANLRTEKPSNHASGSERERFIRDKYERRKFYDPAAFGNLPPVGAPAAPRAVGSNGSSAPSEAARLRAQQRRLKQSQADVSNGVPSQQQQPSPPQRSSRRPKAASAPASAPVDLLDFGGSSNSNLAGGSFDPFASAPAPEAAPAPAPPQHALPQRARSNSRRNFSRNNRSSSPKPRSRSRESKPQQTNPPKASSISDDIMSLYNTPAAAPAATPSVGNPGMAGMGMNNMTAMMGNMNLQQPQQPQQQQGMTGGGMNPQQMQQMMLMMQQQMQQNGGAPMNPQQMMMMQQQMFMQQQRMMMMQQQQQASNRGGAMAMNGMPQQQQQPQQQQHDPNDAFAGMSTAPTPMQQQQQVKQQQRPEQPKDDPFASFGLNAFQ